MSCRELEHVVRAPDMVDLIEGIGHAVKVSSHHIIGHGVAGIDSKNLVYVVSMAWICTQ